jgi:arabinogalactan oligomer/maltooligosaccharide transport system substrate-binding protein
MKTKKWFALALTLLLTLSLAAPALAAEKGPMYNAVMARFTGQLEAGAVVQVLENDTAIQLGYVQELIDAFNAAYASQGVSAVIMDIDQYSDLATDGPYGYGPDVWYQANDILMKYATKQHLLPLPVYDMECYDFVPQNAWDAYAVSMGDETFYCGAPINVQEGMLYYIESMLPDNWQEKWDLNQNGTPDFFETYTALYALSEEIKNNPGGKTQWGYLDDLVDTYFSSGYLFTFGGYVFGQNDTDPSDIGFNKGEAWRGCYMLRQWAAQMNNTECLDKAFSSAAYAYLANGTMLCTVTTPDVYRMFIRAMVNTGSWTDETAAADLKMIPVPRLPKSGDLTADKWQDTITNMEELTRPVTMMGGINGYGISSYTKCPNASLAFIQFACSYEQVMRRNAMLGITPARSDAAAKVGESDPTVQIIFNNLDNGFIDVMPAINEAGQIWTPGESFFVDLTTDAYRAARNEPVSYDAPEKIQAGLDRMVQQIYDAIFTMR